MKMIRFLSFTVMFIAGLYAFAQPSSPTWAQAPSSICVGETYTFQINPVNGATGYNIYPTGNASITFIDTYTRSITLNEDYDGYQIHASACNSDGCSSPNTVNITTYVTVSPDPIEGNTTVTTGASGEVYSIPSLAGASSIIWSVPNDAILVSGQNTNSISVDFDATFVTGNIAVFGVFGPCGAGETTSISIQASSSMALQPSTDQNYIMSKAYRVPISSLEDASTSQYAAAVTINYFDGLGRPIQQVQRAASPNAHDVVTLTAYDNVGRQNKSYLPFVTGESTGAYKTGAVTSQTNFYNTASSLNNGVTLDTHAWSETVYEPSPLNRVAKQLAPGASWAGASRGVATEYEANVASDNVYGFKCDAEGVISVIDETYYDTGKLFKTATRDEDDHLVEEYMDMQGKEVCKRTFLTTSSYTETCYIYDDFDNLRYVIQPQGVAEMGTDWAKVNDMTFRDRWMFQYRYDARKRMILKKVPGAQPVLMVYDQRDRLVLTQDGNQRGQHVDEVPGAYETTQYEWTNYDISASGSVTLKTGFSFVASNHQTFYAGENATAQTGQWLFTKYDELNRPVITGIYTSSKSRAQLQTEVDAIMDYSEDYVGNTASDVYGYDNSGYPTGISDAEIMSVTYYDNYDFVSDLTWGTTYTGTNHNQYVRGQTTGGLVRILGGGMLKSVTYYDDQYRVVKTTNQHHLNGYDREILTYFNGIRSVPSSKVRTHIANGKTTIVTDTYTYDHMDRLLTATNSIGSGLEQTLVSNDYNELGQLTEKSLGGIQDVNYAYNIRGWMTTINGGTSFDDTNDKFGIELKYNSGTNKYYNGNIGEITWKALDGKIEDIGTYRYSYDGLNRLVKAIYSSSDNFLSGHYDVTGLDGKNISYDLNGNIKGLQRKQRFDLTATTSAGYIIDKLSYQYTHGNQLSSVNDMGNVTPWQDNSDPKIERVADFGFYDGATDANEYLYDANGNMIYDGNKGISDISYNYLNLPESVTTPNGTIEYLYDATGVKLRRIETSGKIRDYIGGIHYEQEASESSPQLEFVQYLEGRAVYDGSDFAYQYNITDHLGNVRITVDASGAVIQRDDYYPFGLTFNSYAQAPENLYKYNGFEEQQETGWYDYIARQYDPALGRFLSVDPAADLMRRMSPYAYAFNNPIRFIDPDGMVPTTGDQDDEEKKKKEEKEKQEQETRKLLEDYYAQFGMTLEEGVGQVKSDATSNEDSDAKKSYESGLSTKKKDGPSNWEMLLSSAGKANDIVEFYGEMSGVKVPGKIGTAITIFQVGDKYFKQDEAGLWIEVGKAALGRLVGGYTILAAETFIAVGQAQAHQQTLNMNNQAMKLYRTGVQLQRNGNTKLANEYFERAIKLQNHAIDAAKGLLKYK